MTNRISATNGAPAPAIKIQYRPKPGLGALVVKNLFLNIVTLYIYSFWAKTEVRKHIWSCVRVMDEPLEYIGTGKELFLGFLIVTGLVIVPLFVVQTVRALAFADSEASVVLDVMIVPLILFLFGVGTYRARRYRLSRTLWCGIKGALTGSPTAYGARYLGMTLLLPLTLLWTYPWMQVALTSRMTNEMTFGNRPFSFAGTSGPLYRRFAIVWIGMLLGAVPVLILLALASYYLATTIEPNTSGAQELAGFGAEEVGTMAATLAIVFLPLVFILFVVLRCVYTAAELNYIARCTGYEGVRFTMNATTGSLIGLSLANTLLMIVTAGIAAPFVQQNLVRYLCDRLTAQGALDVAAIRQTQARPDRTGEGIAEVFDIDAF